MFIKFAAFKMHEQKQSSEQVWSDKKKSYKKIDLNKDRFFISYSNNKYFKFKEISNEYN